MLKLCLLALVFCEFFSASPTFAFRHDHDNHPGSDQKEEKKQTPTVSVGLASFNQQIQSANHYIKHSTSTLSKQNHIEKKFYFDPVYHVDKNRGQFVTKISIPLPSQIVKVKELQIVYNSQNLFNHGPGTGLTWDLPFVKHQKINGSGSGYKIVGGADNSDLVLVKRNFEIKTKLQKIAKWAGLSFDQYETYRPRIDKSFSLYNFMRRNGKHAGVIQLALDGSITIFDSLGRVHFQLDSFFNSLEYTWKEGSLRSLKTDDWRLDISYFGELPFKKMIHGKFAKAPAGIKNIVITDFQKNNRTFRFTYESRDKDQVSNTRRYLTQVLEDNAVMPLFLAKYKEYKPIKTPDHVTVDPGQVMLFSDSNDTGRVVTPDKEKSTLDFNIDLNGDMSTDLLRFSISDLYTKVNNLYSRQLEITSKSIKQKYYAEDFNNSVNEMKKNYVHQVYFQVHGNQVKSHWKADKRLFLDLKKLNMRLIDHQAKIVPNASYTYTDENGSVSKKKYRYYHPEILFHKFNFINLNDDSAKDLVYCESLFKNISEKPIANNGKPHSNLFLSIYGLKGSYQAKVVAVSFFDIFELKINHVSRARTFIQKLDENKLQRVAAKHFKGGADSKISYWTGLRKWKEFDNNLRCHQDSIFHDFNQDGFVDVLTGRMMYFGTGQYFKRVKLSIPQIQHLFEEKDAFSNGEAYYQMTDFDKDGVLELRKGKSQNLLNNGKTHFSSPSESFHVTPGSGKLLSEIQSPFGGKLKIQYQFKQGLWGVKEIQKENETKTFTYNGAVRDSFSGVNHGFLHSEEVIHHNNKWHKTHNSYYYADDFINTELFKLKAPKTGLLKKEETKIGNRMIVTDHFYKSHTIDKGNNKRFHLALTKSKIDKIEDILYFNQSQKYKLSNIAYGIPLLKQTTTSSSLSSKTKEKKSAYKYNTQNHRRLLHFRESKDSGKSTKVVNHYNDNLLVKSQCLEDLCQKNTYDLQGRAKKTTTPLGSWREINYLRNTTLPTNILTSSGKDIFDFDLLTGNLKSHQNVWGGITRNDYTIDGLIKNQWRNEEHIFHAEFPKLDCQENCLFTERKYSTTSEKGKEHHFFDEMGRKRYSTSMTQDGKWFSPFKEYKVGTQVASLGYPSLTTQDQRPNVSYQYSDLGKIAQIKTESLNNDIVTYSESHRCQKEKHNKILMSKTCSDSLGELESFKSDYVKTTKYQFKNKQLTQAGDYSWKRDSLDFITDFQHQTGLNLKRNLNLKNKTLQLEHVDILFDNDMRVIKTTPQNKSVIEETYQYKKGQPKQITKSESIYSFQYNNFGQVTEQQINDTHLTKLEYNKYGQVTEETHNNISLTHTYNNGELISLIPIISSIERDKFRQITQITFSNGTQFIYNYNGQQKTSFSVLDDNDKNLWTQNYKYNNHLINKVITKSSNGTHEINTQDKLMHQEHPKIPESYKITDPDYSWEGQLLSNLADSTEIQYDHNGEIFSATKNKSKMIKHGQNLFELDDQFIKRIQIEGITIAVSVNDQIYPAIEDFRGSLVALIKDSNLLFERTYDLWGIQETIYGDKDLSLIIPWSFSHLIQLPWKNDSGKTYYWSQSRVYLADNKSWASVDPAVIWQPELIQQSPNNWQSLTYSLNDPVNFVDPSGHVALPAVLLGAGIGGTAAGVAAYHSGARGWDLARATIIGAGSGALAGTGIGGVLGSMGIGLGTNVVSQLSQGKSFLQLDPVSATISTLAGGLGAGAGNLASKTLQLPYNVIGNSLPKIMGQNSFSNAMISTGFSGFVGGMTDVGGHNAYGSMDFGGSDGIGGPNSSSQSFSDSFSDSWWNQ